METVIELHEQIEREEKAFDSELVTIGEQIAAIEKDARFSPEHKAARIAAVKAQGEAQLQERVKNLWDVAQRFAQGASVERQATEMAYEQTFDGARLSFLANEYAAKLSAASSLDDVARVRQDVASSGDAHRVRASRIALIRSAQTFLESNDQSTRARAQALVRELSRENDTTPEIEQARDREKAAAFKVKLLQGKIERTGEQIKRSGGWQRGFFDDAMGKPKASAVIFGTKSNPISFG